MKVVWEGGKGLDESGLGMKVVLDESGFGVKVVRCSWMKVVLDESCHGMKVFLDESGLGGREGFG